MSNLSLPTMSFPNLERLLDKRTSLTLGYATTATRDPHKRTIHVLHHGNEIARLTPMTLWVSNAGYSSSTTRSRLNKILLANGIPFSVGQKSYEQILTNHDDNTRQPFTGEAQFIRDDNQEWELV